MTAPAIVGMNELRDLWWRTFGDKPLELYSDRFALMSIEWLRNRFAEHYAKYRRAFGASFWQEGSNMCGVFSLAAVVQLRDNWLLSPKPPEAEGTLPLFGAIKYIQRNAPRIDGIELPHMDNWTVRATPSGDKLKLQIAKWQPQLAARFADPLQEFAPEEKERVCNGLV